MCVLLSCQVYEAVSGGSDEVDLNGRKVNTRAYCSWYNFKSADQQKKVGVLSGKWEWVGGTWRSSTTRQHSWLIIWAVRSGVRPNNNCYCVRHLQA